MQAIADFEIRPADAADLARLQEIRAAAFAPIFASFREALGEALYDLCQRDQDEAQPTLLASLLEPGGGWELFVAVEEGLVVGFVSCRADAASRCGEIGLNAVLPECAGRGIGTRLYRFAAARLSEQGMRAAGVSVGGDAAHAAARRAYEKAGFGTGIPHVWLCAALNGET
ncbi:MAG TPA: GNAT family N-acetyltransferase [Luteimonas sp.]|nr:GNAT family N-acetyltransferase [Luteimonas sp.]